MSGNTVAATDSGHFAGPGSTVSGNTAHAEGFGGEVVDAFNVTCPSNVIGNTATGRLNFLGEGCTNIDNLVILP